MIHLVKTNGQLSNTPAPRVSYIIMAPIWQAPWISGAAPRAVVSAVVFDG
jgi:hypothetical protein